MTSRRKFLVQSLGLSASTTRIAQGLSTLLLGSVSTAALNGCDQPSDQKSTLWKNGLDIITPVIAPKMRSISLHDIRLNPSIFKNAHTVNTKYLLSLSADRLLHNFYTSANLPTKGEVYGGWEARGIAGHTLGHYLTACSLMFASTGNGQMLERVRYIVAQLTACQNAHGDGYVGGTTVERGGKVVDGKLIFEELRSGDIRTGGFDINGGWVPLYTWHKVHAGLIDAVRVAGIKAARPVLLKLSSYLADILDDMDEPALQKLLTAEFGGLNESYADLYAITNDRRWLDLAKRLDHRSVLAPLETGDNPLPGLHANTQIPKIIGAARLYGLSGDEQYAKSSENFLSLVRDHYSYVIGGNSDREHFGLPDQLSEFITDRTCEACNSYNMMKLSKRIYAWSAEASLFDYYERMHLNHIMGHQHPDHGGFVYFMPLASGSKRLYSQPEESFWCCVGSGMESHSKHAEAAYWQNENGFFINLFMASDVIWREGDMNLNIATQYPMGEDIDITITQTKTNNIRALYIRIPQWVSNSDGSIHWKINQENAHPVIENGYAKFIRPWLKGDKVSFTLPMTLSTESVAGDASVSAFLHGPLVLGADLGPATQEYDALAPALIGTKSNHAVSQLAVKTSGFAQYQLASTQPKPVTLRPFFNQYDNRSAVYFKTFSAKEWSQKSAQFIAAQKALKKLAKRTLDIMHLGEMQPERDHNFRFNHADMLAFGGKTGRQAWWGVGNWMAFDLTKGAHRALDKALILDVLYWGEEINKDFDIHINGQHLIRERRVGPAIKKFVNVQYELPQDWIKDKSDIEVKFTTKGSDAPVYEARLLTAP